MIDEVIHQQDMHRPEHGPQQEHQLPDAEGQSLSRADAEEIQTNGGQDAPQPDVSAGLLAENEKIEHGSQHRVQAGDEAALTGVAGQGCAELLEGGGNK